MNLGPLTVSSDCKINIQVFFALQQCYTRAQNLREHFYISSALRRLRRGIIKNEHMKVGDGGVGGDMAKIH